MGTVILISVSYSNFYKSRKTTFEAFPDFITKNEDYFVNGLGNIPNIDSDSYRLTVSGEIDDPRSFSLIELQSLNLTERPLTTECIGNQPKGEFLATAV